MPPLTGRHWETTQLVSIKSFESLASELLGKGLPGLTVTEANFGSPFDKLLVEHVVVLSSHFYYGHNNHAGSIREICTGLVNSALLLGRRCALSNRTDLQHLMARNFFCFPKLVIFANHNKI